MSNGKYLPKEKVHNADLSQSSSADNFGVKISSRNYKTPNPEINSKRNAFTKNKTSLTVSAFILKMVFSLKKIV